ncbi:hypothetical protein U0355_03280 [Salimicrobium sp. PL1-032A]|uniref:hypothetical protein n=1 Tax=Salimicrobium sp. PL1-032A TaxID=3095364 RepID=UPI003261BAAB
MMEGKGRTGIGYIIGAMLLLLVLIPVHAEAKEEEQRVMVGFEESIDYPFIQEVAGEVLHTYDSMPVASLSISKRDIDELRSRNEVAWVEYDQEVSVTAQEETWGYTASAPEAGEVLGLERRGGTYCRH